MNTMISSALFLPLITLPVLCVAACGVSPPNMAEIWQGPDGTKRMEFEIKRRVYCDLKAAVQAADAEYTLSVQDPKTGRWTKQPFLPDDWDAQISLLLQVDESSAFNPGIGIAYPFSDSVTHFSNGAVTTGRSFTLGLRATVSSQATRIDKYDPSYSIGFLRQPDTIKSTCLDKNDPFLPSEGKISSGSFLLESDLGLTKWLSDAIFVNILLPSDNSSSTTKSTPDSISIELKFIVTTNGSINPVWKLLPITFNNGAASLVGLGRVRTHDLLITIGPVTQATANTHLASQIGQAVSSEANIIRQQ